MENKLENLKEKMDGTILRDVYFDDKQYQQVLNSIKKSEFQKQPSALKNKFNSLLSIAVVSFLFLGITYFVGMQLNLFKGTQASESNENIGESPNLTANQKAVHLPSKQEENYTEMTKEEILTKMINSIDHFETATGEYKIHYANIPSDSIVEYAIRLKHKPGGFAKRTNTINGKDEVSFEYYQDGSVWQLNEETKTYMQMSVSEGRGSAQTLTIEDAFLVDNEGTNVTNYRERPPIAAANETLFPYEIASNYTRDLTSWEIEKQNEELLGHNTLVIKGVLNSYASKKGQANTFRFWVDKDSGILVKYETYNASGEVVDYLHPIKLEINVPIDDSKFTPDLDGYKKEDMTREDEPSMTTGNIDDLIPVELKEQWDEAKKNPDVTSVLHLNDKWYIYAKQGYLVDRIEENGKVGTLYLAKAPTPKLQFSFHSLLEGYNIESLDVVYNE